MFLNVTDLDFDTIRIRPTSPITTDAFIRASKTFCISQYVFMDTTKVPAVMVNMYSAVANGRTFAEPLPGLSNGNGVCATTLHPYE